MAYAFKKGTRAAAASGLFNIQNTARALIRTHGMNESAAIATAVNAIKAWAAGTAFGGKVKVTPEVQQAAQRALAEWEKLKASHHELR